MAKGQSVTVLFDRLQRALDSIDHWLASPDEDLGASETLLLAELDNHPPVRPGILALRLNLSPGRITQIVQHLEELDLLHRSPDPDDRRSYRVALSAQGRLAAERATRRVTDLESTLSFGLGRAGEAMLRQQLRDICKKLDPVR
jgi:DNA-binding MarR family transcriptional regulator